MKQSKYKASVGQYDELYTAVLQLKSITECRKFFRDLCTLKELADMTERWAVVQLLEEGLPYRTICERTGSSTATITRIAHWLNHGEGGYRLIVDRSKKHKR